MFFRESLCFFFVFHLPFSSGTNLRDDIIRLCGKVHVVVATPGRLLDLAERRVADLSAVDTVVLDEADKLLSPDFVGIVEGLLKHVKRDRQILMFRFLSCFLFFFFSLPPLSSMP